MPTPISEDVVRATMTIESPPRGDDFKVARLTKPAKDALVDHLGDIHYVQQGDHEELTIKGVRVMLVVKEDQENTLQTPDAAIEAAMEIDANGKKAVEQEVLQALLLAVQDIANANGQIILAAGRRRRRTRKTRGSKSSRRRRTLRHNPLHRNVR